MQSRLIPVDNLSLPRVFSRTAASLFQIPADAFRNSGQGIARAVGGYVARCAEMRRDVRTEALTFRSNDPSEMIWRMTLERQMQRPAQSVETVRRRRAGNTNPWR